MGLVRVTTRLAAIAAVSLSLYLALLVARLAASDDAARRRRRDVLFRAWARATGWIMGMRARRQGPVPERPFLLVCNHLGYVDILLLGRYLPAVFVAKTEVADWPLLGRLVRAADTIFVDRDRKRQLQAVNGRIRDALDGGAGVVLFAEGTSSPGHTVLPLRPSLLQVATGTARPVHWAVVRYATGAGSRPAEEAVCWWGDMGFFSHLVGLLRLRSFEAAVCFGAEPVMDDDRKRLAEQLGGLMRTGLAVC